MKELIDILESHSDSIAFIVGNGFHRYYETALSWNKLMENLWNKYASSSSNHLPEGIPNTELYDIIEMEYCKRKSNENGIWLRQQIEKLISNINIDFAHKKQLFSDDLQNNGSSIGEVKVRELDIYNHMWIKQEIKDYFSNVSINDGIIPFINYAMASNIPILTTNYDMSLSNKMGLTCFQMPEFQEEQHLYPLSTYFAIKPLHHSTSGFGIWHINGIVMYNKSIRLGLCDYLDLIQRMREIMQINRTSGIDIIGSLNDPQWKGKFTWLDIIFRKSIFIFGLGLNEDEVPLRWLLLQRAKYNSMFNKGLNGWYVTCKEENISISKRLFLENVGIGIVQVDSYKTLYEDIWTIVPN